MNRLAHERSPYLLQHKDNPVDWHAWGDEAFARARSEDKPIFLSIGYSTCHWCHVMAHESFENGHVAAVLNEHFVSIKVDREERPDVDRVYMTFVQATTGSGGWPMSVWLTPDLKPFYGGTYFPPTSRWGRPGFVDILQEIARVWATERAKVVQSSVALTDQLRSHAAAAPSSAGVPGPGALAHTVQQFREAFDGRRGGFGDAPKFPRPSELLFLMREHARTGDVDSRDMALRTLRAMALGGMRDHIGGGFHRYAVDGEWRVPHFEKMLYDQAQLVLAFAEAGQITGDRFYTEVAEDTLQYVQREMTDAGGAFYSAEDADSEGREGAFYVWTADEIDAHAGGDAAIVRARFGVLPNGNAPQDPQAEFVGRNILYVAESVDDLAREHGRQPVDVVDALHRSRVKLFEARLSRPRPHLDDKILTAWNGLMIAAFARMARVTGSASFLASARRAAAFIREQLWRADGTLLRRYRDGHAEIDGYAEDYAYLIFGLLELVQADADPVWLEWAIALQRQQDELFWDGSGGAWFSTTGRDPSVLLRMKEDYDGAEPTASSISVLNLLTLSHLVEDAAWIDRIERAFRCFGTRLEQVGRGVPMMAAALSAYTATLQQIVIAEGKDGGEALARAVAAEYLPFAIVLRVSESKRRGLAASLPFLAGMTPIGGESAAYVCHHFTCRQPVTTADALHEQLRATA